MPDIIPREALAFLRNKKLRTGFSYKDVWHEEHAAAFTVAKAMQMDVLSDLHTAVIKAMEQGQSFEGFKKNIKPILEQKGWWGKKQMLDPLTGNMVNAQLGSDRRLKTIYRVNMRSAYQKGQYDRTMASSLHPYLMYRLGNSRKHREEHLAWEGLILPKDDPWWDSHFPPNGWGCNCYTVAVSEARKKRYEEEGIPTAPRADGSGGGNIPAQTVAPPEDFDNYVNERKGTVEKVPSGVAPAFNWNQAMMGRTIPLFDSFMKKGKEGIFYPSIENVAKAILSNKIWRKDFDAFIQGVYSNRIIGSNATAIGFLDRKISRWLHRNAGITIGDSVTIALEARLFNGPKGLKHSRLLNNAVGVNGAHTLIDVILFGDVFFDGRNLIYLFPHSAQNYTKITVNPLSSIEGRSSSITGPVVVNVQTVPTGGEATELNRIRRLRRIR